MFDYLVINKDGILIAILILIAAMILLQWFCWTLSIGRFKFKNTSNGDSAIRYVIAEMLVKIINDFRHLLALVIALIFAASLAYALLKSGGSSKGISEALQSVTSTLGGLLGAIIGYYFGESAAKQKSEAITTDISTTDQEQSLDSDEAEITQAPSPRQE